MGLGQKFNKKIKSNNSVSFYQKIFLKKETSKYFRILLKQKKLVLIKQVTLAIK